MFSYWTSFVPENPLSGKHNLISCILKETSNRGRMVALNALLVLLSSSKLFLAQAEKGYFFFIHLFISLFLDTILEKIYPSLHFLSYWA
jgi:hypothetical protein